VRKQKEIYRNKKLNQLKNEDKKEEYWEKFTKTIEYNSYDSEQYGNY